MPAMYLLCPLGTQRVLTGSEGPRTCSHLKTQVVRFPTAALTKQDISVDAALQAAS